MVFRKVLMDHSTMMIVLTQGMVAAKVFYIILRNKTFFLTISDDMTFTEKYLK